MPSACLELQEQSYRLEFRIGELTTAVSHLDIAEIQSDALLEASY
jgi:hypothetical protein